jgi:response regulator RpfG family c-di-GMP phosphodiesterase
MPEITIDPQTLRSLLIWSAVTEAKDPYTGGHLWRTSQYAHTLAVQAGLSQDESYVMLLGALVHDIGKLGIPEHLLRKKGLLSPEERSIFQRHPVLGKDLIQGHPLNALVIDVVFGHHECYDGSGYPSRTAGDQIPIFARIATIADSFDAMTSVRAYKIDKRPEEAYQILLQDSGAQFDPALAAIFVEMGRSGRLDHIIGHSSEQRLMLACPTCGPLIAPPRQIDDGDDIDCPTCGSHFTLHASGDSFEVEWAGEFGSFDGLQPDLDEIEEYVRQIPRKLRI